MQPVADGSPDRLTVAPLVMKWSVFLAAASGVVYLCLLILRPFFGVFAWSAVLAISAIPFISGWYSGPAVLRWARS